MKNLYNLRFSSNQLSELPPSIGNLTNISYFFLSHNTFTSLPYSFNLTSLPESRGDLTKLSEFYLDNNKLISLPNSFGQLKVKTISIKNNSLFALPDSLGNLKYLYGLYLDDKNLIYLSTSFQNLFNLRILDFAANILKTILN